MYGHDGNVVLDRFIELQKAPRPRQHVSGLNQNQGFALDDIIYEIVEVVEVV